MQDLLVKKELFDLSFAVASKESVRAYAAQLCEAQKPSSIIFANAHVVVEAKNKPRFKSQLQKASLLIADGKPLAWLLNTERYSGPDFMLDFINQTKNKKHFFIGATPEVLEKLKTKFKDLQCQVYAPPFTQEFSHEEKTKHIKLIKDFGADFIWVGLGAPKQEQYAIEMAIEAQKGVWLAVGAAFDFISGNKKRAPLWMQSAGLEWAFRFATEPRRLALRYIKTNPAFMSMALKELTQRKRSG